MEKVTLLNELPKHARYSIIYQCRLMFGPEIATNCIETNAPITCMIPFSKTTEGWGYWSYMAWDWDRSTGLTE